MSNPVHGVNLRSSSLICEAHKNAVSAKVVQQCPDCYRLLAKAEARHGQMWRDRAKVAEARVAELEALGAALLEAISYDDENPCGYLASETERIKFKGALKGAHRDRAELEADTRAEHEAM